jgi:hypothetical protein
MYIYYSRSLCLSLSRTAATFLLASMVLVPAARSEEIGTASKGSTATAPSVPVASSTAVSAAAVAATAEPAAVSGAEEVLPVAPSSRVPGYLAPANSGEAAEASAMLPMTPAAADGRISSTVKPGMPYTPLTTRQKAKLQLLSTFQPSTLARISFTSGMATLRDSPNEWPRTIETYNWRFADRVGQRLVYKSTEFMVGSVLFHEDPRYFLAEERGTAAKLKSALKQTWMARRDDGSWAPAWGAFAGAYTAGYVSAQWMPESRQSMDAILIRSSSQIGFRFCNNLLKEFMPSLKKKFGR